MKLKRFLLPACLLFLVLLFLGPWRLFPQNSTAPSSSHPGNSLPKFADQPKSSPAAKRDLNSPQTQITRQLDRLREQRQKIRQKLRAQPGNPEIIAELQKLTDEETSLTQKKAELLDLPLVTPDGSRLSHFQDGHPIYLRDLNTNAAISTAADQIQSTSPYNVDGSDVIVGLWEVGGLPRSTHNALTGHITLGDSGSTSDHATHVAGTILSSGSGNSTSLGMAPDATITAYEVSSSSDHELEASAIAATGEGSTTKIYLSNHSYSTTTGWVYDSSSDTYSWYGTFSDDQNPANDEASSYGQYSSSAATLDDLAQTYPYLAMFFAAGNDRGYDTPSSGETWKHNGSTSYTYDPTTHPGDNEDWMVDGSVTGFGTISPQSSAKNIISIGSVSDAVSGESRSTGSASISYFSSYGPTDDGRIKPDLVANGESLTSTTGTSNSSFGISSGTSMAAPNAAGSAALLVDYYDDKFSGESMRSSMLKALLIHSADDLGKSGPDYRYGWGLINAKAAADIIKDSTSNNRLLDGQLATDDSSDSFTFDYDDSGELRVTLVWNDPEDSFTSSHDSRSSRLVHDLNLTLTGPDGIHYPYIMPWQGDWSDSKLNDNATTGVNNTDNVEQIYLSAPASGSYTLTIDHAGSLSGDQIYSLILTGGSFPSEVPDGGSNQSYTRTVGFGSFTPFNIHDLFDTAHETTYSVSVNDTSIVTAALNGAGDLTISEVGVGSTNVLVTATNDLGDSSTVRLNITIRNNIVYVDTSNNSGSEDGLSWATAFSDLPSALSFASTSQEIWVAEGVYYPVDPTSNPSASDRNTPFEISNGLTIYGGFDGSETSLDERDPDSHLTILSGDLDRNDNGNGDGITDTASDLSGKNSLSLLVCDNSADGFTLDGFVLTAGQTDSSLSSSNGAGVIVASNCNNGTIANCTFKGFHAEDLGSALYVLGSNLAVNNCTFSGNLAEGNGGALTGTRSLTLTDCTFQSNQALGHGGALHLSGSTHMIRRCIFQGNSCELDGGACSFTEGGTAALTNCLITGNDASGGSSFSNGGAFAIGSAATITITNSTICSNNSEYSGGAFWVFGASKVYLRNVIVYQNARDGDTTHWSAFYWVYDNDSTIFWSDSFVDADPGLTNVPNPGNAPTLNGNFLPASGSGTIDTGGLSYAIEQSGTIIGTTGDEETDLRGYPRVVDGNYNGTQYIDIGCYEEDQPIVTTAFENLTFNISNPSQSATVDLDDHFGGNGLSYQVSTSSNELSASLDSDNALNLVLSSSAAGDASYTVTVTATDVYGQQTSANFTVTFEITRFYVDASASGSNAGHSWDDALLELRDAISQATTGDEIWIAAGVYKPSANDETIGFTFPSELSLYGGFSGGESKLDEADPTTNLTIISGDIDNDDTVDANGITLSYLDHGSGDANTEAPLITIPGSGLATLSGLIICGGKDSAITAQDSSELTIDQCTLRGNFGINGGSLEFYGSSLSATDSSFLQNSSTQHGGAICFLGSTTATGSLTRCIFSGNFANQRGGAVGVKGSTISRTYSFTDCLITGNRATGQAGAFHNWISSTKLILTNCTIASNIGNNSSGGLVLGSSASAEIYNSLLWGNGNNIRFNNVNASASWQSSIIESSGGSSAWDSSFGTDLGDNLDTDPLFVSQPANWSAPTLSGDFTFDSDSPAFDAGDDSLTSSSLDLLGNNRIFAAAIDLGAYENISYLRPTFALDSSTSTVNEDSGPVTETGFVIDMEANDEGQSLTAFVLTTDKDELFSVLPTLSLDGTLSYTPADDASGTANVTITLYDDGTSFNSSQPQTFPIIINPVNDPPTFTIAGDLDLTPTGNIIVIEDFLTNLDLIEDDQNLNDLIVTNDNSDLFFAPPSLEMTGSNKAQITFRLDPLVSGQATIDLTIEDDGGTDNGGSNSHTESFTLTVSPAGHYAITDSTFSPRYYQSLGTLDLNAQDLTIDGDDGTITGDQSFTSSWTDVDQSGTRYRLFLFDEITLSSDSTITIQGDTPVALMSRGAMTLSGRISFDGGNTDIPMYTTFDGENGGTLALISQGILTLSGAHLSVDGEDAEDAPFPEGGVGGKGGELSITAPAFNFSGSNTLSSKGGDGATGLPSGPDDTDYYGNGGNAGTIHLLGTGESSGDYTDDLSGTHTRDAGNLSVTVIGGSSNATDGSHGQFNLATTPAYLGTTRLYVDADRSGQTTQTGLAWDTALADLRDALAIALPGDEIWVAEGLYYPDEAEAGFSSYSNDSQSSIFSLADEVSLYGGFDGSETLLTQRDPDAHFSILSGDIDHESSPDTTTAGIILASPYTAILGSNSLKIVKGTSGTDSDGEPLALLDGFTITGASEGALSGGGRFQQCVFQGNNSESYAGVANHTGDTVRYTSCRFFGNRGTHAATIYAQSSDLRMTSCHFQGNEGVSTEGGSGAALTISDSGMTLFNCLITGNDADGGAILVRYSGADIQDFCQIHHTTIANNQQDGLGYAPAIYVQSSADLEIENCLIWGNTGGASSQVVGTFLAAYSLIEGMAPTGDNFDGTLAGLDPLFRTSVPASAAPSTGGNYRLYGESFLINSGYENTSLLDEDDLDQDGNLTELIPLDLAGNARNHDGHPDPGCYEYHGPTINSTPADQTLAVGGTLTFGPTEIFDAFDTLEATFGTANIATFFHDGSGSEITTLGTADDSTTVTLTATSSATGDQARVSFTLTLIETLTLANFRTNYGLDPDGSDDDGDLSGNQIANLLYFAFGLGDPNNDQVDLTRLPVTRELSATELTFTYLRPEGDAGLDFDLVSSTDLDTWIATSGPLNAFQPTSTEVTSQGDGYEQVTLTFPIESDESNRYYRLKVADNAQVP